MRDLRLYVADTLNNRITVIGSPLRRSTADGPGTTLLGRRQSERAAGPHRCTMAAVTADGQRGGRLHHGDQREGMQVAKRLLDDTGGPPPGDGALFGLVFDPAHGMYFVDDATNTLNLLH